MTGRQVALAAGGGFGTAGGEATPAGRPARPERHAGAGCAYGVKLLLFTSRTGAAVAIAFHSSWPHRPKTSFWWEEGGATTQAVEIRGADQGDGRDGEGDERSCQCGPGAQAVETGGL